MTAEERRLVFLHVLLTECWNTLNHAMGFSHDPECIKLISNAYDAVDKAKAYSESKVNAVTNWEDSPEMEQVDKEQ